MVVPQFEQFFQPVLKVIYDANGKSVSNKDLIAAMTEYFSLSEEDLALRTKGGNETQIYNRVQWARNYLESAGYAQKSGRGRSVITDMGRHIIENNIELTYSDMRKAADRNRSGNNNENDSEEIVEVIDSPDTPEDIITRCVDSINESLSNDLLAEIKSQTPAFFEHLVVDLLSKIYGGDFERNSEVTGQPDDKGIDGIVRQDRLGFDNIYIQAKKWEDSVGRKEIQAFSGALDGTKCTRGAFITASYFTSGALEYAKTVSQKSIVLIDGKQLTSLMIEYGVGVQTKSTVVIKKIDHEYFDEE